MVEALKAAGGDIRYTEYRLSGHTIWDRAYNDNELITCLFAQHKSTE